MPELPEVESNRRSLNKIITGKVIQSIDILWPKIFVDYPEHPNILHHIFNQHIIEVNRRGKYLIFVLNQGYIISHLRMEGKFFYYLADDIPQNNHKHTHLIMNFTDGSQLHYNDVRKFGRMEYVLPNQLTEYFSKRKLGPEPSPEDFILEDFIQSISQTQRMIKPALLSQEYVVGLGNIYVDEVLFRSKIHPQTLPAHISHRQYQDLHQEIIKVLQEAVAAGGSTIRTYRNSIGEDGNYQEKLQVYGKQGKPCSRCGTRIEKIKVAQRGTHFCPQCQRLERNYD